MERNWETRVLNWPWCFGIGGLGTSLGMQANVIPLTTVTDRFLQGPNSCWGCFTRQNSQWVCHDTGACAPAWYTETVIPPSLSPSFSPSLPSSPFSVLGSCVTQPWISYTAKDYLELVPVFTPPFEHKIEGACPPCPIYVTEDWTQG